MLRILLKQASFALLTTAVVLLVAKTDATDTCFPARNQSDTAAFPSHNSVPQNTSSCRSNVSGNHEVHVLGVFDNKTAGDSAQEPKTTQVNIQGGTGSPVILVLVNTDHVTWTIQAHKEVPLAVVVLMSNSSHTTVDFSKAGNVSHIPVQRVDQPTGTESLENASRLVHRISDTFLSVTSFTGTDRADKWVLHIGHQPAPTTIATTRDNARALEVEQCLKSTDCWLKYNFQYDDNWNDCHGKQFVRQTSFEVGKYIGVVLCSVNRYKLFMSDDLRGKFLNMADGSGGGRDHCTLIGGLESLAKLAPNTFDSPTAIGYYRSFDGQKFTVGKVGFGPKDASAWTGKYYPTWYECGVDIPGQSRIVTCDLDICKTGSSSDKPGSVTTTTTPATSAVTSNPPIDPEEACMLSSTCWLQYNFTYDDSYSACSGDRYVRKTGQTTGRYLGVILCSSTRYKLVMADNLTETFLNIGDGSGAGEDQCILIGGDEKSARVATDFWSSPATRGFYRSFATDSFKRDKIGHGPKDLSQWTGKYYPTWYECGVTVPGNASVIASTKPLPPTTTTTTATTSPPPTTETPVAWDDVTFGQAKFTEDRVFVVPKGVTKLDVICIGGGGGGRDDHASGMVTGDGGNSTFGDYLSAEGGKGASADNSGGEGGYGTVARGGQGGAGGGCSAGAGAAGQTSGGGHGGKEAGSSTYAFCGAGGSSGGSSCGSEFGSIPRGKSGPGGVDPKGRAGGFYGGGGGSRAGGRAGGGGGYSRAVIEVTPGQRVPLRVGKKGSPAYWAGQPAPGVVVVAWGGPIDPMGSFVDYFSVSEPAPPTTTAPPTTPITTLPRKRCDFRFHCSGGYRMGATCVSGFCECSGQGYNKYTCLPEVGSCRILANQDNALGVPSVSSGTEVHSCVASSANSSFEVHVIGIYENTGSRSVIYNTVVNIEGRSRKPMVLVLTNYEPVRWIIRRQTSLDLKKVLLYSYYLDESSVHGSPVTVTKAGRLSARGDDSGGGKTKELLTLLRDTYGDVASFTGTYRTSSWTLRLPDINTPATPGVPSTQLPLTTGMTTTITAATTTLGLSDSVVSCLSSSTCWLQYNFTYDDSYSACSLDRYVRKTGGITGRYIGVVLCSPTRYKLLMADNLQETFLNIGDGNGSGQDICPLIGGDEKSANIPSDFWKSPAVTGYYRYNAGEAFSKGPIGFGPADRSQWTGKYFSTWYECGVSVPGELTVVTFQQTTTTASPTSTTKAVVTPTPSITWDAVPFGQKMYKQDDVFVVPNDVTKLDVICIGGGGGGRDDHVPFSRNAGHAGDGGNSRFGDLLWAEGGKGARKDNTGGEGGRGMTANGGQGGIGGGCSAGAGAAGQTSGGGHDGLEAGSSTHPFCGAGGSSGGSTCGTQFDNIAPGKSGPGGQDPVGRAGGLYGGGGGSRAGARAGGGGGYSRRVITVTPGQKIPVVVGGIGTPYYVGGRPAPGVVVVSWGGPINPNGNFQKLPTST